MVRELTSKILLDGVFYIISSEGNLTEMQFKDFWKSKYLKLLT